MDDPLSERVSPGDQPRPINTEIATGCTRKQESKGEFLRQYNISIRFLTVGCVINVGCKEVAFSTIQEGMTALNAYVANPIEEAKKWNEIFNKEN